MYDSRYCDGRSRLPGCFSTKVLADAPEPESCAYYALSESEKPFFLNANSPADFLGDSLA
jgi:hypothetical protein